MTTSETPIEPEAPSAMEPPETPEASEVDVADDGEGERADAPVARGAAAEASPRSKVRLISAVMVAVLVVLGWLFVAAMNRFHVTVPVVVMSLGWTAVILSAYLLIRLGVATALDEPDQEAWWRPVGKRDELEREKRSLLKAIKEIEFDREMGKMTDADAAEILRVYRAHAIEVIKALDHVETGGPRSVRDEIDRELRARMAVSTPRAGKRGKKSKTADKAGAAKDPAKPEKADQADKPDAAKESAP